MTTPLTRQEIDSQVAPLFTRHTPRGIYLANHSLGRPLDATQEKINEFLNHWYNDLDDAWEPWLQTLDQFHTKVAHLLHLPAGGNISLKTSAGQGLRAVLNAFPQNRSINILTTSMEFDSIDFILRTYQAQGRAQIDFVEPTGSQGQVPLLSGLDLVHCLQPHHDLIVVSVVNFTTGQLLPELDVLIEAAHAQNTLVLLDTYHAFGVIDTPWPEADFAIGGSYKYVHGGPGACWLAVSPQIALNTDLQTLDTGWFAKKNLFGYDRTADRAQDHRAWWESTPPVIEAYQAIAGLEYLEHFTIPKLRATNLDQQAEMRAIFLDHSIPVHQPQDPEQFGAFSLLPAQNHKEVVAHLKANNIKVDSRNGFVRFGPHPLNTPAEFQTVAQTLAQSHLI